MKKIVKLAIDLDKKYQLLDKDPDELSYDDVDPDFFEEDESMDPEDAKNDLNWFMPDKWFMTGFVSRFKKLTPEHQEKVIDALIKSKKVKNKKA